jgi:hypothetical protein
MTYLFNIIMMYLFNLTMQMFTIIKNDTLVAKPIDICFLKVYNPKSYVYS